MTEPRPREGLSAIPVLAVNSQTVPHASPVELLDAAVASGLGAVEVTGEVLAVENDLGQRLRERSLHLLGVSPTRRLHRWHWQWDEQIQRLMTQEMGRAAEAGAAYFVMPFMQPRGDAATIRAGLAAATPLARDHGLQLAVEPIGHHPVLRRLEELIPVLESLDGDVVGLLLDSFHFFRAGHAVADLALLNQVSVLAVQLSNAKDMPIDALLGYRDRTYPLDGPFDVLALTRELLRRRPGTPLVVEVIGEVADRGTGADGVCRSAAQLNVIMTALDLTGADL